MLDVYLLTNIKNRWEHNPVKNRYEYDYTEFSLSRLDKNAIYFLVIIWNTIGLYLGYRVLMWILNL